jgi:hypothetical protein
MVLTVKKAILIFVGLFLLVLLLAFWQYQVKQRGFEEFQTFYQSDIQGELRYLSPNVGVVFFKISGDDTKYGFIPTSDAGNKKVFSLLAAKGDIVTKAAFADTLTLYKNGSPYRFTFKKLIH